MALGMGFVPFTRPSIFFQKATYAGDLIGSGRKWDPELQELESSFAEGCGLLLGGSIRQLKLLVSIRYLTHKSPIARRQLKAMGSQRDGFGGFVWRLRGGVPSALYRVRGSNHQNHQSTK